MKWENDAYRELKWGIFDLIKNYLSCEAASKVTISDLATAIDKMMQDLVKE